MMTYTFELEVGFYYEPTRTEVSNLSKYVARRTTVSVVATVHPTTVDDTEYWTVKLKFTCTRVQAARALFAPKYASTQGACLYVLIPELVSWFFIANLDQGQFNYSLWPTNASIPTNVSERHAS